MKKAGAKVYMEFLNYEDKVVDRVLIAEFNHENWADDFMALESPYVWGRQRLVKEVANA